MKITIIQALLGNHLDDTTKTVLVAITHDDLGNFIRNNRDAKSMLEFVGVVIDKDEYLINIKTPPIYLGASMQQDVEHIANAFKDITNNFL